MMKLRIRGNLLRFRLGRSEVKEIGLAGRLDETVSFGEGQQSFGYSIERTDEPGFSGSFSDGTIVVRVPGDILDNWVNGDEVGIEGKHRIDTTTELAFLIEKDFVCINSPREEDQSDNYPHPSSDC